MAKLKEPMHTNQGKRKPRPKRQRLNQLKDEAIISSSNQIFLEMNVAADVLCTVQKKVVCHADWMKAMKMDIGDIASP